MAYRCIVPEMLETANVGCFHLHTERFADLLHGAAAAASHIPSYEINLEGRLDHCTTSTTAEFSTIDLALEVLLRHS